MGFKDLDDVEREKRLEEREKVKKEISKDTTEVLEQIMNDFGDLRKRKKIEKDKKRGIGWKILKLLLFLFLLIFTVDLLLGSVWLLKFFIKSLFNLG